jgi:hypothetical protein
MRDFSLYKRKTFPYLPRNELYFALNGKTLPYFPFASFLVKTKFFILALLVFKVNFNE